MMKISYYLHRLVVHIRSTFACRTLGTVGKGVLFESVREIKGGKTISIGHYSVFGFETRLACWGTGKITIGNNCHFGDRNFITSACGITIGNDVLTGANVLISDNAHGEVLLKDMEIPPIDRKLHCKGPVTVGDRVWLGNNVCVLSGIKIGDGAIVGANSVVTHDIPPYCMVAGVPAKIIKNLKE